MVAEFLGCLHSPGSPSTGTDHYTNVSLNLGASSDVKLCVSFLGGAPVGVFSKGNQKETNNFGVHIF